MHQAAQPQPSRALEKAGVVINPDGSVSPIKKRNQRPL
jgi:hypothetical protein